MAIRGLPVLLLGACTAPVAAARQGEFVDEVGLQSQTGSQDDDHSTASGQEATHVQNRSLTREPTLKQIKMASASAGAARNAYVVAYGGGELFSIAGVGGTIISKGIRIWIKHKEIAIQRKGVCAEFMRIDIANRLLRVWEKVICPAAQAGSLPVPHAINWLLCMETFLAVLAYVSAHPDTCDRYISAIQTSWNDMADGAALASDETYVKYVTKFKYVPGTWPLSRDNIKSYPVHAQRTKTLDGLKEQLALGTTWNPFRSTSSLDKIIRVAIGLRLYNDAGELTAPECLDERTLTRQAAMPNAAGIA